MKSPVVITVLWLVGAALGCTTFVPAECRLNQDCSSDEHCNDGNCEKKPAGGSSTASGNSTASGGSADCSTINDCGSCSVCADNGKCAGVKAVCEQNIDCVNLTNCLGTCGSGPGYDLCVSDCGDLYPGGVFDMGVWLDCVICGVCAPQCPASANCGR